MPDDVGLLVAIEVGHRPDRPLRPHPFDDKAAALDVLAVHQPHGHIARFGVLPEDVCLAVAATVERSRGCCYGTAAVARCLEGEGCKASKLLRNRKCLTRYRHCASARIGS
ncbi:hypothetical protein MBAV_003676 [Candidatus Magnetobacterium bavaricum]|uniref:Uncharacterized protein n=1 Tax=Candidatus Magnetobacterium bavaricum TaxID=29290 RepID=A0A0F3GQF4_9BACT|nr:hypothetical protein MBAV_003676 [Candidatus Magnetobacterium bavaricum]